MYTMNRRKIVEIAEKVSQIFKENQATDSDVECIFYEIAPHINGRSTAPVDDDQGDRGWLRFELHFEAGPERDELYQLLDRLQISRRELALIVLGLPVRPGFSLEDFDT